ncbi:MAG: hypothetical protein H8K03_09490 [Nitrospira sp.]
MTPAEAAAALFKTMPPLITAVQLEEYGIESVDCDVQRMAREILSLNLYWLFAAVDAHIPLRYRAAIKQELLESIQNEWWNTGRLGAGTWVEYHTELNERQGRYGNLVDQKGISHMGVCAEAASLMEDQGLVSSENREKLLVLLIDYAPASEYGRLLEEAG